MMRTAAALMTSAFLLLAPAPIGPGLAAPRATPAVIASIDQYVAEQMAELHIPGLALTLIVDGKVAYERGYGVADFSGRPVTPDTPFILGSTSKQFTGIAVQQLVRAGRLDLGAPVASYLPWFGEGSDPHATVTIRQLLSHTSGIEGLAQNVLDDGGPHDTLEANAHRLAAKPLVSAPGSRFAYSNENYDLLGYLVEAVSGQSYGSYMGEHVFGPLGLRDTYADKVEADAAGLAAGFYPWFGVSALPTPMPYTHASVPSVFLISSAHDLGTVALAQLGSLPDKQVDIDAGLLAATRAPLSAGNQYGQYASGWYVRRFWLDAAPGEDSEDPALPLFYYHPGSAHTYRSYIGFVPDEGFGLAMVMNATDENYPAPWDYLGDGIIRLALGRQPLAPTITYEDPLVQNAKLAYVVGVVVQTAACFWSLRARRRRPLVGVATIVNLGALGLALMYAPSRAGLPLVVLMRLSPDMGLMTLISIGLATVWFVLQARQARMRWPRLATARLKA